MALNGHGQSTQEALGGVEVHDQSVVDVDLLFPLGKGVGVQGEIDNHLFRGGCDAGEVGIGRMGVLVMDRHFNLLILFGFALGHGIISQFSNNKAFSRPKPLLQAR